MKLNLNSGIYKITSPSGKVYIGRAKKLHTRYLRYSRLDNDIKGQVRLYRSFLKYGVENHIFEVIEECEESELSRRERYWQDFYDVTGANGLNCILEPTDNKKYEISEELREKYRKRNAGKNNPRYGKRWSEEHKKAQSEKMKGRYAGEKNPMYGKSAMKGRKASLETIEKMRTYMLEADHPSKILVLCTETGIFYNTIREASEAIGINKDVLAKMLRGNKKNTTSIIYA